METILIIIGAMASIFTIWNFASVRIKRNYIEKGISFVSFKKKQASGNVLSSELEDYRTPDEDDLQKGDWSWAYDGKKLPFITHGNFFGDGKLSEALILIRKMDEKARIVVRKHDESEFIELMEPSNSPYNIQLDTVPIGKYKSHWEKMNLKLETHGIRISFLESAEVIMYWDKELSSFKEYWTAD